MPLKLAIVGGGPSAFYVASRLLSLLPATAQGGSDLRIHVYDRLWAPHGLVRYGVAPDHPEVKNCTHKFDTAASDPRFRFFGNINIGQTVQPLSSNLHLPLSTIFQNYTHVLFATGCTLPKLHPALPPSPYCIPALNLVHWYTQHPSSQGLPPPELEKITHVSLIGNGNVSLDIARMLLTPVDALRQYDVPQPVLEVLAKSNVQHVSIIGRRGPLEAAFTTKELREMMNLPDSSMVPIDAKSLDDAANPGEGKKLSRQKSRVLSMLQQGSKNQYGSTKKTWSLDFFRSPTGLIPPSSDGLSQAQLTLAHTALDQSFRAVPTGESSTLSTSLVVTSLGFNSEPTAPYYDPGLGHLRTVSGRIVTNVGTTIRNAYASGWAATGAKGVLASTMINAYATAETIAGDWLAQISDGSGGEVVEKRGGGLIGQEVDEKLDMENVLNPDPHPEEPPREVQEGIKNGQVTQYEDWRAIDAEEVKRGEALNKERERMGWTDASTFLSQRSS